MIFNKLRLVGKDSVDFPLFGADPAGPFILKGVDGLGPPERDVKIAKTIQEGGVRQGTRTQNRQIVALVGVQPNWDTGQTAADLRNTLYGLLTPKYGGPVIAQVMNGSTVVAQTQGDISRFEVALFSQNPQVQITMDCDYPYLLAPTAQTQNPAKSTVSGKTAMDISNAGTAPAGFWLSITLQSAISGSLVLSDNSSSGEYMSISGPWNTGDKFTVDTRAGQRGVWRTPSGSSVASSVLGNLSGASTWLQLHGGDNRLLINSTSFTYSGNGFEHTPAYWGV